MSDTLTRSLISSRSMKLVAGGVSLLALALLAMLAVRLICRRSRANCHQFRAGGPG